MKQWTGRRILAFLTAVLLLLLHTAAMAGALPEGALLLARKRKNTPTPAPTETVTPGPERGVMTPTPEPEGPIIDPQSIADYLFSHGELPENFITKKEARALGWDPNNRVNLSDVAPGMSIGGDFFGNYEGILPVEKGVEYHEADCWYTGGKRSAYRIIYSNQGRVWYTEDHYQTFTELFPTVPRETEEIGDTR